ncbi:putative secreted protein (Por secretion system target) [Pontibacter mucosus]|uniref:Putative secreted protein (Por secretion system target) n=1 Tax=Pontibacter mucosus TaxID=1649266 RepID=A0A2T5YF08_9BACT|nr:two-component regulator propeller domain-containing protein [Pontibacter mucosus]PTX15303.1 putative secreted protein (Por secretion system target) [Pontibacter mucosus]
MSIARKFILAYTLQCLLLGWWCSVAQAQSQVPIGGWQVHVPYHQGKAVAVAGDKVYLAAERGLFYYDTEFNTTETISKVDGLSEQQISDIAFSAGANTLVIAYHNTKVDLLQGNRLHAITDIFRKSIAGEKKINRIYTFNQLAYLATSFGVVVLDLPKREVKETYSSLGPNGESINATDVAILGDKIYLATSLGVLSAPLSGANLQDFRSWRNESGGLPENAAVTSLAAFQGKLYAGTTSGVYTLSGDNWSATTLASGAEVKSINTTEANLSVVSAEGVTVLDASGQVYTLNHALPTQPQEAVTTTSGEVWLADKAKGLVKLNLSNSEAAAFAPGGPYASDGFRIYTYGGKVYVVSGGYTESYEPFNNWNGFYTYSNGAWQSFNRALYPQPSFVASQDLASVMLNLTTNKLYLASYGSGLIEWESPDKAILYNQENSPLLPTATTGQVRVTDVAVDYEGNVWVVNPSQQPGAPGLHQLSPDGTWQSYTLNNLADASNLTALVLDDYGQKWLSIARRGNSRSGLVVFDEQQNRTRTLGVGEGNGGLPSGAVYSMAKDFNGDIWVGTASGIGIYYNTALVFESGRYDARIPIIDGRPLLDGQIVRSIAVDGANRKWVGTDNGLWLFSPDGDAQLHHFTTQNSPLPSDKIYAVGVEHQSGEVFVATDAGVASFRSNATLTEGKPDCAMVFPNPVRPEYTGEVGVSGLPNNADVRITDVAGTLVYKGKANGGTFAWNARDYNGNRVKAGVYLVLGSNGEQTCISKIAVLE